MAQHERYDAIANFNDLLWLLMTDNVYPLFPQYGVLFFQLFSVQKTSLIIMKNNGGRSRMDVIHNYLTMVV